MRTPTRCTIEIEREADGRWMAEIPGAVLNNWRQCQSPQQACATEYAAAHAEELHVDAARRRAFRTDAPFPPFPSRSRTMSTDDAKTRRKAPLATPAKLGDNAVRDISGALTTLLADMFALYVKTKNFHWHVSGPHFRDYHLLLDEQGAEIFAATDGIAERVRKIGGTTLRSIGQISRQQRLLDNDADYVTPHDMLVELREDNLRLTSYMRETHELCDEHGDVASASLLENWIDEAERRTWFLFEASRGTEGLS
jgi:starvation-inducible DNA-binding protein